MRNCAASCSAPVRLCRTSRARPVGDEDQAVPRVGAAAHQPVRLEVVEQVGHHRAVEADLPGQGELGGRLPAREGDQDLVLRGRDQDRGDALVKEIEAGGGTARFVAADLTDAGDTLRLAAETGAVDILVSNAGRYEFAPTAATGAASFDRQIAVNTRAPFLLVGALAPGMAEREHGSIVLIGSSAARPPMSGPPTPRPRPPRRS